MRFTQIIAGLLFLLVSLVVADSSSGTTTSTSTTTITRTVVRATATSTITGSMTSASATSSVSSSGLIGTPSGDIVASPTQAAASASSSLPPYSYLGAASIEKGSLGVAAMAGSVALFLGYAL